MSAKISLMQSKTIEGAGVLVREEAIHRRQQYSLTELGRELQPAIAAIVSVGHKLKKQKYTS